MPTTHLIAAAGPWAVLAALLLALLALGLRLAAWPLATLALVLDAAATLAASAVPDLPAEGAAR